jgi:hypothetical protein
VCGWTTKEREKEQGMTVQDQADTREWELRPSVTEEARDFTLVLGRDGGMCVHTATCEARVPESNLFSLVEVPAWWVENAFEFDTELHGGRRVASIFCGLCTVR